MQTNWQLKLSLLLLRIGVFIVLLMWALDKLIRPQHTIAIFERFYHSPGMQTLFIIILAIAELVLLVLFICGMFKFITYGLVLIIHAITTFACFEQYLNPFDKANLLFFAAWPMLAACIALFLLRKYDTWFNINLFKSKHV